MFSPWIYEYCLWLLTHKEMTIRDVLVSNVLLKAVFLTPKKYDDLSAPPFSLQTRPELRLQPGQWREGGRRVYSNAEAGRGFPGEEGEARGGAAAQLGEEDPNRGQEEEERGQWAQTLHGMWWRSGQPGPTRGRWQIWYVSYWPLSKCWTLMLPNIKLFNLKFYITGAPG